MSGVKNRLAGGRHARSGPVGWRGLLKASLILGAAGAFVMQ